MEKYVLRKTGRYFCALPYVLILVSCFPEKSCSLQIVKNLSLLALSCTSLSVKPFDQPCTHSFLKSLSGTGK